MLAAAKQPSRDADIRRVVHRRFATHHHDDPETLILDEFQVCRGQARVDIAVLNGTISGYELKSAADHLRRVPNQVRHYGRVFDSITMVVAPEHVSPVAALVPSWYGLWLAEPEAPQEIIEVRPADPNPNRCVRSLCQLLWRNEMLSVLEGLGAHQGMRPKPRRDLITAICENLDLDDVAEVVRSSLRKRHAAIGSA